MPMNNGRRIAPAGSNATRQSPRVRIAIAIGTAAGLTMAATGTAFALDEKANEKAALKACEKQICQMVVGQQTAGADFSCSLSKTWAKSKIEEGIKKKKLSWGFGDARCTVDVKAKRGAIVGAITKPTDTLQFDPHTVACEVERASSVTKVNVTLAPKISFKDGRARKAWIGVQKIDAPSVIKGAIWTVAQVENNLGLFHADMISEINEFIAKKCPKAVNGN